MKRTVSILLAAVMAAGMAAQSFAQREKDNRIVLSADTNSGISLEGGLLTPGEKYRFPVSVSIDGGEPQPLNPDVMEDYSFKLSNTGEGDSLVDFNLSKSGDRYYIAEEVKAGWPTAKTEEEYSIKMVNKSNRKDFVTLTVSFETGYELVSDEFISALDAEDEIEVDNSAPVFDAEQLERIAKRNQYKKVTFTDGDWRFTVSINDMKAVNLVHNQNAVKEIVTKYEDHSFEFLTFPSGPQFRTNGVMELDVSAYADDFNDQFFVYRYLNGKLTEIPAQYHNAEELLTFTTDTLGRFIITDKEIADTVVFTPAGQAGSAGGAGSGSPAVGGGVLINPSTGSAA